MNLSEFLQERLPGVLSHAGEALQRASLAHYPTGDLAHARLEALADLVVECAGCGHVTPMATYAVQVARERFHAGFQLYEVQTAFNVLEEALWLRILEDAPVTEQAKALTLVATILGAGKDALAREYVALASREHAPAVDPEAIMRSLR